MFGILEKMDRFSNNLMTQDERIDFIQELVDTGMIYDMHDKLKSITSGYGTMDYELLGYHPGELVRLDVLVNKHGVKPTHSLEELLRLKELLPDHIKLFLPWITPDIHQ